MSVAGLASFALTAAEPGHEPPGRPDPSAPRSFEADPPAPLSGVEPVTPAPRDPALGDDGIRDPGEDTSPARPRPGVTPDSDTQTPWLGDDGIRDPGEAQTSRPRPGVVPASGTQRPAVGDDGIREPDGGLTPGRRPGVMPEGDDGTRRDNVAPGALDAQPRQGTRVIPRNPTTGTGGAGAMRDSNPSPSPGVSGAE